MNDEKLDVVHTAHLEQADPALKPASASSDETPHDNTLINGKPFWQTAFFLGTYLAIALSACGYYAAFAMPSNTLSIINADIGPSLNITWVSTGFTLTNSIASLVVGRVSDIFGRRYFFIAGSVLATIGTIVASTAQSVNQLIGGTVLCGLASGTQSAYPYVVAEIVPFKYRYLMIALVNIFTIPTAAFGPLLARAFILHTAAGWRWNYYFAIIINGLATICWATCYHPPTFAILHEQRTKWQQIKRLDFVGLIAYSGGFLLFLLGLSWGGSSYPWVSAKVLGTLITGGVTLICFVFWELYSGVPEPFLPMHIFRNYQYDIITLLAVIGGMVFYANAVIYPTMIQAIFTTDIYRVGVLTCAPTAGTTFGLFVGGLFSERGYLKLQYIFCAICLTTFTAALAACGSFNLPMITAFAVLSGFFVGYLELLTEAGVTIVQDEQMSLGTIYGVVNTLRAGSGAIALTVYVTILQNRLTSTTKSIVVPAVVGAGLPIASVPSFLQVFSSGSATQITAFPGITAAIIAAATTSFRSAYAASFQTVFLTSIAFGSLAVIGSFFYKEISEDRMQRGAIISLETAAHQDRMIVGEKVLGANHENYHAA